MPSRVFPAALEAYSRQRRKQRQHSRAKADAEGHADAVGPIHRRVSDARYQRHGRRHRHERIKTQSTLGLNSPAAVEFLEQNGIARVDPEVEGDREADEGRDGCLHPDARAERVLGHYNGCQNSSPVRDSVPKERPNVGIGLDRTSTKRAQPRASSRDGRARSREPRLPMPPNEVNACEGIPSD